MSDFAILCPVAQKTPPSSAVSQSSLKLMSIKSAMLPNHLIFCRSLLFLPSIFPGRTVSFNNNPSNEYLGLISFRIDWFDLFVVQGTLKSLLQHHSNSKASILWCSDFFMVQFSHLHMTPGKIIALTIWTFVSEVLWINIQEWNC